MYNNMYNNIGTLLKGPYMVYRDPLKGFKRLLIYYVGTFLKGSLYREHPCTRGTYAGAVRPLVVTSS